MSLLCQPLCQPLYQPSIEKSLLIFMNFGIKEPCTMALGKDL